jgi:hypothetical protein
VTFRHNREFDLPERLTILSPSDAFDELRITPGERPFTAPPVGSGIDGSAAWWIP